MNILFVVPRIPNPPDTGGKIRTHNLLKQAMAHGHHVTLLPFCGSDKMSAKTVFQALVKGLPVSVSKYRSRAMAKEIVRVIDEQKIDLVHFDHIHMGQYLDLVPGIPAIIDEHNVECLILKRLADNTRSLVKKLALKREYQKMAKLEVRLCSRASKVLFVSEEDRQNYGKLGGNLKNTAVIPNGVDVEYFRPHVPTSTRPTEDSLVFTGSMDWVPNSDAVAWFCQEILPLIWQKKPEVIFYVVGKNPPDNIKKLGLVDKRVVVTGGVPDVRPYVERSKVFVVPLRIGGGTRLKILESLSMEKAVVSTTIGAEGIEARQGEHLILADKPQCFADEVVGLMDDPEARERLGRHGHQLVCEKYDWKVVGKKLQLAYGF